MLVGLPPYCSASVIVIARELPPPIVDLRLLQVFWAVSELGSMTAAAERLGLTQSAVSQSLRQLEKQFKVSLFSRHHRPLQVTSAGAVLRERAAVLLEQAARLPSLLQESAGDVLPMIRIAMVDSFASTVGPLLIKELLPVTSRLVVYAGLSPSVAETFQQRSVDLVVSSDPLMGMDGLERHLLLREPFLVVVPAGLARELRTLKLDRIAARLPLIRYSARSHIGTQIEVHLRRVGVQPPRAAEVDTSDTLMAMVASGCGWAITTPMCFLQGRAYAEEIVALPMPGPRAGRSLTLLARSEEYANLPLTISAHARRLLSTTIVREMRRAMPWVMKDVEVGVHSAEPKASV
jgi:DNA-binding transcriptional LysR family regulator